MYHDLIDITVGNLLEKWAKDQPDHLFVKFPEFDYKRTYGEFNEEVDRIAKSFMALGIEKGDKIAVWSTNKPEWILSLFAACKIGAVLVTVNTNYKVFEAKYLFGQSDTKLIVMSDNFKDTGYVDIMYKICPEIKASKPTDLKCAALPCLKTIVTIDKEKHSGMLHWSEIYAYGEKISDSELQARKDSLDPYDVVNMQYTSGTTGFPKGVMLTHHNIVNNGMSIGDCMNFSPADKLCIPVPFFHCFGLVLGIMASVTHGAAMVPISYFSPLKVMSAIQNERCTAVHGVPTMFIAQFEHSEFKRYDFSSLRTGIMAGSPCPIKVMQLVVEKMNMREITITYGQTEASPACTMTTTTDSLDLRVTTVGKAIAHVEAKIVDPETGETLPPHTPGEFCARGYNIMKGYYKMPEATAAAIDADGWLHTGDIATVDENGYYNITGRLKDMIIRGGENIYPKEIEELLYTHPKIQDVQIVAAPSREYGEEICAFVIPRHFVETLTDDEVKDFVRDNMSRHKVPRYVSFVESFPMNAAGKILKYKLREMCIDQFNLQEESKIETA